MTFLTKSLAAVVGLVAAASVHANVPGLNPVPEPGSLALVAVAIGALALVARKGKK